MQESSGTFQGTERNDISIRREADGIHHLLPIYECSPPHILYKYMHTNDYTRQFLAFFS